MFKGDVLYMIFSAGLMKGDLPPQKQSAEDISLDGDIKGKRLH